MVERDSPSLGVHLTLDLGGQAKFRPDVRWVDAPDSTRSIRRAPMPSTPGVRHWPPALPDGALQPGYVGCAPSSPAWASRRSTFASGPRRHGVAGLVNLLGIESPGLTNCLAIAALALTRLA